MCLIDAIHQGAALKTVAQYLCTDPESLNRPDAQGNTALHYAVAGHNIPLIEFLIKQGANIQARNQPEEGEKEGKTPSDWFQEYITSTSFSPNPGHYAQLEALKQEIAGDNIQFVADALKLGVSRALRFSQGKTLLHFAVEEQKIAIIALILQGVSYQDAARLLHAKDSQGVTPLALAQRLCHQSGTRPAQEIFSYLQEKQRLAAAPENVALIPQTDPAPIDLNGEEVRTLTDLLSRRPLNSADFRQLNPLRLTLVKLACVTCVQAQETWQQLLFPPGRRTHLEGLLKRLFGVWDGETALDFQRTLCSVSHYLDSLIRQNQVDRVIQFSAEESSVRGLCCHWSGKIILYPTKTSVAALVMTLIHEVTHKVERSYDFFTVHCYIYRRTFSIDLKPAVQLASHGITRLTLDQRKIFEVRQLLKEGFSGSWQENLYRWMALNSAETLAAAIVASAAVQQDAGTISSSSDIICIYSEFLQNYAVAKPSLARDIWSRISPRRRSSNKDPSSRSASLDAARPWVSPVSPAMLSTASGGSSGSPNTRTLLQSESFSLSPLPQAMAALTVPAAAGPSGLPPAETPAPLLLSPLGSPSKPQCPIT